MNLSLKINELKARWMEFWNQESNQAMLACLPLYFSWYPVLLLSYKNENVRRYCFRSLFSTALFFGILILSLPLSKIPVLGSTLGNLVHILGILIYLGLSAFFIYNIKTNKKMEIAFIERFVSQLESSIS